MPDRINWRKAPEILNFSLAKVQKNAMKLLNLATVYPSSGLYSLFCFQKTGKLLISEGYFTAAGLAGLQGTMNILESEGTYHTISFTSTQGHDENPEKLSLKIGTCCRAAIKRKFSLNFWISRLHLPKINRRGEIFVLKSLIIFR